MKTVLQAKYTGGHPGHPKPETVSLHVDDDGLRARVFRTILEFPWDEVTALDVEGSEQVEQRVTATRLVTMGLFAFAAKKKTKVAYLTVTTAEGEAIFEVGKHTPAELQSKLAWTQRVG